MHRLPRQALRLRSVARLERAQRPVTTPFTSLFLLRRHYAIQKTPTQNFDRILASLRPNMNTDEFAKKFAALLVLSERNEDLTERVHAAMKSLGNDERVTRLFYRRVKLYMAEPPEDNYDAFVANLNTFTERDGRYTELPTDPSLEHPWVTLKEHLNNEEVRDKFGKNHELRRVDILEHLKRLQEDFNDMEAYIEVAKLLEDFGVPITYQRRTTPSHTVDKSPEWIEDARAKILEYESMIADTDSEFAAEMVVEHVQNLRRVFGTPETSETPEVKREESQAGVKAKVRPAQTRSSAYPNLMVSDPLLDSRDVLELPPDGKEQKFHNRVIIRNHTSIFHEAMEEQGFDFDDPEYMPTRTDETEESASSLENLPLSPTELANYYRFPLIRRRVTQQTGKGKIHRMYCLMVVGNGNGMVGLGQGKDDDGIRAEAKAYAQAVRNMDWVERFENRTIWTDMDTKLGSTRLLLRPRPVGFGLRCNPNLHQVLKAAGIKDISAKVWGSRNPINVIKAVFRVLQAGHAPLGMGDGIGGRGRKLNKGTGLRSKEDVERERGRQLISLRK